jgi:hypothetical protein
MIEVEFFPKVNDRSTHSKQSVDRILNWMTTNKKLLQNTSDYRQWLKDNPRVTLKEKSEKKVFYFPAVTFAGTFDGTGKSEDINIISDLIVLDFDHIKNLTEIQDKLKADPYSFLLFVSPSGDGLKVVVKHDLNDPSKWQYLYYELEAYYLQIFNGMTDNSGKQLQTDEKCKDISRMCFLPYVDDLYRNDKSIPWTYSGVYEQQKVEHKITTLIDMTPDISDSLYHECYYLSAYLFENKINITDDYGDWISFGYSLCSLGETGREIYHNISCISEKYDPDECDKQYDYMICHYDPDRTNMYTFINSAKTAIANFQLFKQYGFNC